MKANFVKLKVCQLSEKLADEIWDIVISWSSFAKDTLGKQIVRSADSVATVAWNRSGRTVNSQQLTTDD